LIEIELPLGLVVDRKNGCGLSLIRASYHHQALDKIGLFFVLKVDASSFKFSEGFMDDSDSSFNDELASVNFGLGLLDLQETLGDFGVVGDLHKIHALNLNSRDHASSLEHLLQVLGNDRGVVTKTGYFWVVRSVGKLGADSPEDIVALVSNEIVQIQNVVKCLDWFLDRVSYDG